MNELDVAILIGTILGIAAFGIWRTRKCTDLNSYLKGNGQSPWWAIGLSVMATQASAITFLSTPGQGYLYGLSFIQIYFGMPLAIIVISIFFLPIFHKLKVYTAYEYLEKRFDRKTRLLGAGLFLIQRGIGAGLTIYAPAIVLSTVFGWSLQLTIISCGLIVTVYTLMGGTDAVTVTQKYQLAVIFTGMITAICLLLSKLPPELSFVDTLHLAGGLDRLNAVNFSTDPNERYTIWSGLFGASFLMLSYFGTDQSQVQRYISGESVRESRLGLLFNAFCKIPLQLGILSLGVLMFVFYQFQQPPVFFDTISNRYFDSQKSDARFAALDSEFKSTHAQGRQYLETWLKARKVGDESAAASALLAAAQVRKKEEEIRTTATAELASHDIRNNTNSADYVFISFILRELPHGVIGLLVTAFLLAALSSKAAELNALGTSTTVDFYRRFRGDRVSDRQYLTATKLFTAAWGGIAIVIALSAHLSENLIQAVNILGSIFYGVLLALFLVAFFIRKVGGTALFWSAIAAQLLIFVLYSKLTISYLWYPLIGCSVCVGLSIILQSILGNEKEVLESG
ncbi:MAG: sodium:solute symporter [Candidatus Obscuribacterales bacterium]|nr:sodium:solute symporter [Candidatus Obscuribacterales bacterium]